MLAFIILKNLVRTSKENTTLHHYNGQLDNAVSSSVALQPLSGLGFRKKSPDNAVYGNNNCKQ
jgi:hypothetical protein